MLGQVTEWFYHDLLGIAADPSQPGFAHVLLRPTPVGDLAWVQGSYHSVRGHISVRWERKEGHLLYTVSIPANTTATLEIPARAGGQMILDGKPLDPTPSDAAAGARGATRLGRIGERERVQLVAGSYRFETEL